MIERLSSGKNLFENFFVEIEVSVLCKRFFVVLDPVCLLKRRLRIKNELKLLGDSIDLSRCFFDISTSV